MRIAIPPRFMPPLMLIVLVLLASASAATAAAPAPRLTIHSLALPTRFSSADTEECLRERFGELPCDSYEVTVTNSGALPTKGPIVLTDQLPAGLKVRSEENKQVRLFLAKNQVFSEAEPPEGVPLYPSNQQGQPSPLCEPDAAPITCEFTEPLQPDQRLEMKIYTTVQPDAVSALNTAEVSEDGRTVAASRSKDVIEPSPAGAPLSFGPSAFLSDIASSDGTSDSQAGDHPYEFVNRIDVNTQIGEKPTDFVGFKPVGHGIRDVVVNLPLGFLGSAQATPKCTFAQLQSEPGSCAADTMVGHIAVEESPTGDTTINTPIYNMVPEHGVAAEFGFHDFVLTPHVIVANVAPTPAGYVLRAVARELPDVPLANVITTFYGDPAAKNGAGATPEAMFTNPSDCSGQSVVTSLYMDSWEHPGSFNADGTPDVEGAGSSGWAAMASESPPVTGCNALRFEPEAFSVQPETSAADSPTGLSFDLTVPQSEAPGTLATPPLRDATVTLPVGMTVNPSFASGLQACSESQIGWQGPSLTSFTAAAPECPEASRISSVEVISPLIEGKLAGSVYLAAQDDNPFHSLLAGYIVVDDPTTGTIVKIAGELKADPLTGQITGIFDENPQFPFSELKLRFFGSDRGELATPQSCGTFTTTSDLMPWSAPESGPDATPSSSFPIIANCSLGLAPSFSAGTVSNQAGGFSPLTLTIARQDGEQHLSELTVTTPPGLLGNLSGIPLCGEGQANAGTCAASSQIGETSVSSGVGPHPFVVNGGRVYLTGPYNGGPFGLSIVIPAVAGPFDLGNVVVRSSIRINPITSQITVVSDSLPQMIDSVGGLKSGIPADVRTINVVINRQNFTFNPTSCNLMHVTGTVSGAQGATVPVSSRFQAANCATLPFKPSFRVSTQGKTSKTDGASLVVRVSEKPGEANIHKVDLRLPLALPARLTTLQKACTAAVFEANPAECPEASNIGTAIAKTPVLNVPLTGPAYLVSHGGAAFPDVEFVLQGEGVVIVLDGGTDIKKGITYSKFETVPDAPISSFETSLPEGPHSVLAANGNLCAPTKTVTVKKRVAVRRKGRTVHALRSVKEQVAAPLLTPTTITGQNGAVINQATKISVTGCPKVARHGHKKKSHPKKR